MISIIINGRNYYTTEGQANSCHCQLLQQNHFENNKQYREGPEGQGGNQSISQFIFLFQIPLCNSQIPFPFFIFNIFFPFPVTKSQSQCGLNPIFPRQNLPIPIPILPLQGPLQTVCTELNFYQFVTFNVRRRSVNENEQQSNISQFITLQNLL